MPTLAWETVTGWKTVGDRFSRQLWRLESDVLCAEARRRTGLEYFGEPAIDPTLTVLLNSLENEADLHLLGRFFIGLICWICSRPGCSLLTCGVSTLLPSLPPEFNDRFSLPECREAVRLFYTSC